ncbi:N-acetylglucosamine-6-phosphate deacetylase [Thermoanaerobacterium thermosaccharolyticum]|uniref:N-acetylglucosamine-6-phosphate deacetylase n=1 Tax=Thermoanaerobacterium thermosaccharolyticum TaxID=1517 RepID=UPI00168070D7|nr:N-acetylglucosamine-6-phosphate deacetylase [Thermoanaerobacterium thermosaccharolyticum]
MKNLYIRSERIYFENGIKSGILEIEDGKFKSFIIDKKEVKGEIIDYGKNRIIPGIIDVHNHGFFGWSLTEGATKDVIKGYLKALPYCGVTGVFPTAVDNVFGVIADVMDEDYDGARILGIHSEGPFFNRSGENGKESIFPKPTIEAAEKIWDESKGKLRYMSFAPEVEGAYEVAQFLREKGVIVAAAHTNATAKQMFDAIKHGFIVATHTGNAMRGIHHREIGALGAVLLDPDIYNELISDFIHISPDMIRIMFRLKDYNKFLLISDSSPLAGAKPGVYKLFGKMITVEENGLVHDEYGRIFGSSKCVLYGIGNLVEKLNIPLEKVIVMASLIPAKIFGIENRKGSIKEGKDADFVVVDDSYNSIATYVEGKLVYSITSEQNFFNRDFLMLNH